jgi:NAD(P)-dependent dehydrogenase (short-subunit alcohol dehydrogenase family)
MTKGRLDILVNNAGIVTGLDITAVTVEAWQQLMSINLLGDDAGLSDGDRADARQPRRFGRIHY